MSYSLKLLQNLKLFPEIFWKVKRCKKIKKNQKTLCQLWHEP